MDMARQSSFTAWERLHRVEDYILVSAFPTYPYFYPFAIVIVNAGELRCLIEGNEILTEVASHLLPVAHQCVVFLFTHRLPPLRNSQYVARNISCHRKLVEELLLKNLLLAYSSA
jgi:hypothetical protein